MSSSILDLQDKISDLFADGKDVIVRFLGRNRIWPMLVALTAINFILIQSNNATSISAFVIHLMAIFVLYSPFIIFHFGEFKKRDFEIPFLFYVLVVVIHIIYPVLVVALRIDSYVMSSIGGFNFSTNEPVFILICIVLIALNLLLFKVPKMIKSKVNWEGIMKLHSIKVYAVILAAFSLFLVLVNDPFSEQMESYSIAGRLLIFLNTFGQFFLAYMIYYVVYYVHHHIVFNFLLKKKGVLFYAVGILGILFVLNPVVNAYISIFPAIRMQELHPVAFSGNLLTEVNLMPTFFTLIATLPLIILIEWNKQTSSISYLLQERTDAELSSLKQQINPHFFFNTLNNLYSMSLTNEKETSDTILQLSELMRYVIYKGKEDEVILKDEIKYIEDYVRLQSIRLHKKLNYSFNYPRIPDDLKVPPLLFVIFVENAFKHGIEPAESDCFLHMRIELEPGYLTFTCHNSLEVVPESEGGIGMTNLQKRLDLLFEESYDLKIDSSDDKYEVSLSFEV